MALCIAGSHRAGTSMVARLLARAGVDLGPEEELLAPAPDNPEGFWENREFLRLNDELFDRHGGAWDVVPAFPERWWERPELDDLRRRARDLVDRFEGRGVWGWKDPRNSLTLPFWRSLVPDLDVVVCVRNPFEIARSFTRRGYSSSRFSFDLWVAYTDALLAAVELGECVVTHYTSYFHDPEQEVKRVAKALGLDASETVCEARARTPSSRVSATTGCGCTTRRRRFHRRSPPATNCSALQAARCSRHRNARTTVTRSLRRWVSPYRPARRARSRPSSRRQAT